VLANGLSQNRLELQPALFMVGVVTSQAVLVDDGAMGAWRGA
jgi:hypothetical protein